MKRVSDELAAAIVKTLNNSNVQVVGPNLHFDWAGKDCTVKLYLEPSEAARLTEKLVTPIDFEKLPGFARIQFRKFGVRIAADLLAFDMAKDQEPLKVVAAEYLGELGIPEDLKLGYLPHESLTRFALTRATEELSERTITAMMAPVSKVEWRFSELVEEVAKKHKIGVVFYMYLMLLQWEFWVGDRDKDPRFKTVLAHMQGMGIPVPTGYGKPEVDPLLEAYLSVANHRFFHQV